MNPKTLMLAGLALGALALLVWLGLGLVDGPKEPTVAVAPLSADATVSVATGPVEVNLQDGNVSRAVRPPDPLHNGDVITTGPDAGADVVFAGNATVHLGPNASLVIGPHGGNEAQLGAVLLAGSAKVAAGASNQGFRIGTPVGVVQMPGNKLAEVNIQFDQGVKVLTGEVSLQNDNALGRVLLSGQEITLNDIKLDANTGEVAGLDVALPAPPPPPMAVTLTPETGRVLRAKAGTRKYRLARSTVPLAQGDTIRVNARGQATVNMDPNMHVRMGPGARFAMGDSASDAALHEAQGALLSGAIEAALNKEAIPSRLQLRVAGAHLHIVPTDKEASVDVVQDGNGAEVYVRFGEAHVGDANAPAVAAGQTLHIASGHVVGQAMPAYPEAIALRPGKASEVYFLGPVPPVRYVLSKAGAQQGTRHLQVAHDEAFTQIVSAEAVTQDSFAYDRAPMGQSYWRTSDAEQDVGSLVMAKERAPVCRTCRKENVLSDTGEQVVVRYEIDTPTIVFSWASVPDATGYTLRVYAQADLKTPLWVHTGDATTFTPPQPFREGVYYWYVDTHSGAGTQAVSGAMNTLELVYSPNTDGLDLRTPRFRQSTRRATMVSTGRIDPGARLAVNGRNVAVDAYGVFKLSVPLSVGANALVYRLTQGKQPDRYYLRHVTRTR